MSFDLPDPDDIAVRLAKNLGMNLDSDDVHECQGHKGMLYYRMPDGKKRPALVLKKTGKPTILDCEHEAFDIAYELIMKMYVVVGLVSALTGRKDHQALPQPEEFFYVMAEDYEEEPEVDDVHQAAEYLSSLVKHT